MTTDIQTIADRVAERAALKKRCERCDGRQDKPCWCICGRVALTGTELLASPHPAVLNEHVAGLVGDVFEVWFLEQTLHDGFTFVGSRAEDGVDCHGTGPTATAAALAALADEPRKCRECHCEIGPDKVRCMGCDALVGSGC